MMEALVNLQFFCEEKKIQGILTNKKENKRGRTEAKVNTCRKHKKKVTTDELYHSGIPAQGRQ